ncbi:D-alanyl-D-alanine carboxypeptidase/D-alanyl-D-alanine-endopeptidase [Phycicoccus avicenniae]|uniref:D-alanyl-D-alanine carboxypeptidase/D-alanyl-D-alanine-endopeptidase n=1 Tax=Phycicoccus avicenniae TaxID=2828860 RepID=UPI003D2987B6
MHLPSRSVRTALVVSVAAALAAGAPTAGAVTGPRASSPATAAAVAPAAAPAAAAAYTYTAADLRLNRALKSRVTTARFGTAFSGTVLDAGSNTLIWTRGGSTALMPASTTKLVTAHNALTVFGPDARWTTRVRTMPTRGDVVVEATGDPGLSSAQLDAMARLTAAWLKEQGITSSRVWVDDDVFPTPSLAPGWKASYVPDSIAPVRGLVRDQRGFSDTSLDVGVYFRDRLRARGIPTASYAGRANAAPTSTTIVLSRGQTVATLVSRMLLGSDNEIAEALHKLVGIKQGTGASWTGARTAQSKVLQGQGLALTALYDGSGLSRSDRLSSVQIARIVDRGIDSRYPKLAPMRLVAAMPTAGRTGTLAAKYSRFTTSPSKCAAGKVWAKTGRLADVVSLAGFTRAEDGRVKVFAFVVNGKESTLRLRQDVDMLAATVNGCY